jgi:hypothetical protein
MADIPEDSYARPWGAGDIRIQPPPVGGERETLSAFLDWHRETFALKCAGLGDGRLSEKGASRRPGSACAGCCVTSPPSSRGGSPSSSPARLRWRWCT